MRATFDRHWRGGNALPQEVVGPSAPELATFKRHIRDGDLFTALEIRQIQERESRFKANPKDVIMIRHMDSFGTSLIFMK